ncbi:MAG: phosphonate metabolism protein/1,5-bisphosphokinase (PRPP-forming) PhnN [Ramlibacter sp.]|nr:phosphonate metabolism protein/1,5-bisphosphokinase (PRPP-forming) PhnN [Ramlibacter sp.]
MTGQAFTPASRHRPGNPLVGCWVFVCGPSGAGKDSVIALAREGLAGRGDIVFARRMITRPAQPGSEHDPVTAAQLELLLRHGGGLAWHWQAHGFDYAVAMHYGHQVDAGRIVVVNGSREHVKGLAADPNVHCVLVTASPEQLAARLVQRGRDAPAAVTERLARSDRLEAIAADLVIHNSGQPDTAGAALRRHLEALAGPAEHPHAIPH